MSGAVTTKGTCADLLFVFVFFERNGAVEDQMFGRGIGVYIVIARTREL